MLEDKSSWNAFEEFCWNVVSAQLESERVRQRLINVVLLFRGNETNS